MYSSHCFIEHSDKNKKCLHLRFSTFEKPNSGVALSHVRVPPLFNFLLDMEHKLFLPIVKQHCTVIHSSIHRLPHTFILKKHFFPNLKVSNFSFCRKQQSVGSGPKPSRRSETSGAPGYFRRIRTRTVNEHVSATSSSVIISSTFQRSRCC